MKAHSDTLTREDFQEAGNRPVFWAQVVERGSRSRARGFEFRLTKPSSNRFKNTGTHGAGTQDAASWDDHGEFMAILFDKDPEAIIGPYDGREDFHAQTEHKYWRSKV